TLFIVLPLLWLAERRAGRTVDGFFAILPSPAARWFYISGLLSLAIGLGNTLVLALSRGQTAPLWLRFLLGSGFLILSVAYSIQFCSERGRKQTGIRGVR
ncbi:MAG: hypothetical protein ACR2PL_11455, partial [Dehalococcoidia bacterium]